MPESSNFCQHIPECSKPLQFLLFAKKFQPKTLMQLFPNSSNPRPAVHSTSLRLHQYPTVVSVPAVITYPYMFSSLSLLLFKESSSLPPLLIGIAKSAKSDFAALEHIPLDVLLPLLGGICWTIVYIYISIASWRHTDKIYLPMLALSMNIAWEFIYSFIIAVPEEQEIIDHVWFALDVFIIIFTWRNYLLINSAQGLLTNLAYFVRNLLIGVFFNLTFVALVPESSAFYGAFLINLVMSYLFIWGGQQTKNLLVACFKMLGTALTSVYGYMFLVKTDFMILVYVLIFVLDCAYILQCLVITPPTKRKGLDKNPTGKNH